jgi:hypothetical protein
MLRSLIAAALVVSIPTFADEASSEATSPEATFAAEGTVMKVSPRSSDDGVDWAEITFKVTRCIAGPCSTYQSMKVVMAFSQWRGKHGDTLGLVRYDWKDKAGGPRTWALAHRLDDMGEKERFEVDCEKAVANVGAPSGDSAVATR